MLFATKTFRDKNFSRQKLFSTKTFLDKK